MSALRDQQRLTGDVRPIVVNVMNFAKAPKGQPTLLSFDDARTLFHEFGHALHGLLSDVTYPLIAGTNVARDFVELPSQLYEHWLEQPEVLREFAVHAETGEPMPEALLEKVLAARRFNQGFATVEYTASALVDLDLHLLPSADDVDVIAFEKAALEQDRHAGGDGHAPPHAALRPHLLRRRLRRPATTATSGRRCSTPTRSRRSPRPATSSTPRPAKRLHDYVYSAGLSPRSGRGLRRVPRPPADLGCAAQKARAREQAGVSPFRI